MANDPDTTSALVMFCPNKIQNKVLSDMRLNILNQQKQLRYYRSKYSEECKSATILQKQLISFKNKNTILHQENQRLKQRLFKIFKSEQKRQPRAPKRWPNITSERTKRRRIASLKKILLQTFRNIDHCHRAEVSMWLDENRINFSFSPLDMAAKSNSNAYASLHEEKISLDHNYALSHSQPDETEIFQDLDYSEIYDSLGKWKQNHIRRLIFVMDSFRISHEAYHEIRMVSKGHLPPIGRLAKEKKKMSEEIYYEKHPKVSFLFL